VTTLIERHLRRGILVALASLAGLGIMGTSASASSGVDLLPSQASCDGAAIRANVQDESAEGKTPVAGVTVTVTGTDGTEIGSVATGEDGIALICLPDKIDVTVTLDTDTLPDGAELRGDAEVAVLGDTFITNTKALNFFTGESNRAQESQVEKVAQRFADGVRLGLIIAMCSVGLSLIFGTTGLTNFAHGELVTFGGMMAYLLNVKGLWFLSFLGFLPLIDDSGRFQIFLALPLAVVLGGIFGYLMNWVVFARLRKRGIGLISQMVVTVGLSIMLRNAYQFWFGGRTRPLRDYATQVGRDIGPITITDRDLIVSILSLLVLVAVALTLQYSRLGKATRAVSDNPDLASATGIDSAKVITIVWVAGGALAALGGIFRALDEQVAFDSGGRLLFLMFAGITLGGLGSAYGALVGGFVVGVMVEMASIWVPNELKTVPALVILILVLLIRPQGILGKAQRVG
jgi:branched-chain amino acid transport system permease protein